MPASPPCSTNSCPLRRLFVRRSGLSLDDVVRSELSRGFLGPARLEEIVELLALGEPDDPTAGSGRYGEAWRLPLSHQARANLGDRLALLGDTRPGVGVREDGVPDIYWCSIEGGEVTIEIDNKTLMGNVKPFSMARYPVIIDQFRAFVEACCGQGRWNLPGFSMECLKGPPRNEGRHGNRPADSVSWYGATDFCHWLSARLEAEIRLPSEFEWQLAATGGDPERLYPWGREWDPGQEPWRANTFESGLRRSTAVGLYPLGASKAGLLDMAGTIWEWCVNGYYDPSKTDFPTKDDRPRMLRGGAWSRDRRLAHCAYRLRYFPIDRPVNVGFRVVCLSPIEGH